MLAVGQPGGAPVFPVHVALVVVETAAVLALALGLTSGTDRAASVLAAARDGVEALPYPLGPTRVRTAREALLAARS